jgi:hypothetical protein
MTGNPDLRTIVTSVSAHGAVSRTNEPRVRAMLDVNVRAPSATAYTPFLQGMGSVSPARAVPPRGRKIVQAKRCVLI